MLQGCCPPLYPRLPKKTLTLMTTQDEVIKPKNTLELLRWVVYEPELLLDYSNRVKGWKERLWVLLSAYAWIAPASIVLYFFCALCISLTDLPLQYPKEFEPEIVDYWYAGNPIVNFQFYVSWTFIGYLIHLALGLTLGLALGLSSLAVGLAVSLAGGLALGLAGGPAGGLTSSLGGGLSGGRAGGWVVGLGGGLAFGLGGGLAFGLALGLISGLILGQIFGQAAWLNFFISWCIFYYRLPWLAVYSVKSALERYNLKKNPHYGDGVIGFPVFGMEEDFCKEAFEHPDTGRFFKDFLFKRRKYQRPLALALTHASAAGLLNQNRLNVPTLRDMPEIDEKDEKFRPSEAWSEQLALVTQTLDDSQKSNNIWQRMGYFRQFERELDKFYDITLRESPRWNKYYVIALEKWKKSAQHHSEALTWEAQTQEPICANIYRGGEKLDPALDKQLFLGREDLRDTFKNRVLTAQAMPMFFVQGQRRTGKSSLIAFLPDFLDRGFVVVSLDLQTLGKVSVPGFFAALHRAACQSVSREQSPALELPDGWMEAWQVFRSALEDIAEKDGRKIVLAIDEYEELHRALREDAEQGGALLGAMRSFSQSQNRVVFLFAGADFMSELTQPNWNEYFVQAVTLPVDYLDREDTIKLVTLVDLRYSPEILELIYHDTQGHPCLLQKLCQEIVTNANKSLKKDINRKDYDKAVKNVVLRRDNGVVDVFWLQFCEQRGLKDAVRQIRRGEIPADKKQILTLEDHGFIVPDAKKWKLRVPLFEAWLERYEAL